MSETLNALVIGCGKIGGGYNASPADGMVLTHALAYIRHPRFSLAACVDPDQTARLEFMRRWNIANGFASLEEALASGIKFDVASLAAPTHMHIELLNKLLTSEVQAVFAEKPLGGNADAAEQAVENYSRARKPLLVNYLRRFDSAMEVLRQEIDSGQWGEILKIVALYNRGLMNNGSHAVDLIGFLTSDKPMRLQGVDRAHAGPHSGDPTVDASWTLFNGAKFLLLGSDVQDCSIFELQIVCERGIIAIEQSGLSISRRPVGEAAPFAGVKRILSGTEEPTAYGSAFIRALDAMIRTIETGERPASDGRSALAAIRHCDAIRHKAISAG